MSVWGLFLIVFNYNQEPEFEVESALTEELPENEEEKQDEVASDIVEEVEPNEVEEDDQLIIESDQLEETTEIVQLIEEENRPETLTEMASSPYNDILYDYEKDYPISVDDLLEVLTLN